MTSTSFMTQRTLEDTGSNPRAGGKKEQQKHHKYSSPPAHPSVKRVPGLVLGEQSTPTVSHCTTNGTGRTIQGAHTGSGRHGWYLLRVPCPGSRSAHSTGTSYLLSAQVPWLVQERVRQREVFFAFCPSHTGTGG